MYTIQCTLLNTVECRGIMFQLPQNDNIYIVGTRNWKTCLLLYALRDSHKSRD